MFPLLSLLGTAIAPLRGTSLGELQDGAGIMGVLDNRETQGLILIALGFL
jgi:hypothetical protein